MKRSVSSPGLSSASTARCRTSRAMSNDRSQDQPSAVLKATTFGAAATLLLMAKKWIKLADEKAHTDAQMQEQLGDFNRRQLFGASDE